MAEVKKNVLTYEGLKKYEEELTDLKVNKRKEIADKIKEAREQGDLSEELENLLKYAEVYVDEEASTDAVGIGSNVKVLDLEFDEELDFKIVGSTEANSLEGKISNESPVGAALLRKKAGDLITVDTQMGPIQYRILGISRDQA